MTQRCGRLHRRVWTHASDVQRRRCRQADALPRAPTPRLPLRPRVPPVDRSLPRAGEQLPTLWTGTQPPRYSLPSRRVGPPRRPQCGQQLVPYPQPRLVRAFQTIELNQESESRIPRGAPTSLATTQPEPVQSTLLTLLAMGKCHCRWSRSVLDARHATLPRPPPALFKALRTE